ncbi:MAG: gamma-glutamylcyclotransferase [Wenzhouxiangella sp.]|nr:MAG: gamma-glutamylcyclotransferase [Wenzhouxiangella sp.]
MSKPPSPPCTIPAQARLDPARPACYRRKGSKTRARLVTTLHYLAYGSNLHPLRLRERVPSASLLGVVNLSGQNVVFQKISPDGSSKCDLVATGRTGMAFGALYAIDRRHLGALDAVEGLGAGYDRHVFPLQFRGRDLRPFTYRASGTHVHPDLKPFRWYRDLVLAGASYLGLPQTYRRTLAGVSAMDDPDAVRRSDHKALLTRIRNYRDP